MDKLIFQAKKLYFEDTNSDPILEASKLRKIAAVHFAGVVEFEKDDAFVCDLLKRDLDAYSKVMDDPNGVNNYVKEVLDVLPSNNIGNKKLWKCSLNAARAAELLAPLPCSQNKSNQWERFTCDKLKPLEAQLKALHKAWGHFSIETNKKPEEERRKVPQTVFVQPQPSVFKPNFTPRISKPVPDVKCDEREKRPGQKFSYFQSKMTSEVVNNGWKDKPQSKPFQSKVSKPIERPVKQDEMENTSKQNCFKTATEELRLQNIKKNGRDGQHNYGSVKKSLGARKGTTIHSKFQPPLLRNDEDETSSRRKEPEPQDCEVDERLKNIDPKMIEIIQNEIMDSGPKLTWDDIAGLEFAKNTIQEVVVWPMLRPDIFTGLRRPPRGILLFGPPGTGKTLIGKCIASQSGATFLSISASSLTSKWVGDGEKMVRALFAVARVNQPAVVFIDEIDSLLSQRSDTEHESSRRIKTEFLVQLDGVGTGDEDRILIIGATNRPQELDEAARRRLVKRLYIPLPETNARAEIVRSLISKERHTLNEGDVQRVADLTDGYSGADMKHVCQEASLGPIRSIPASLIRNIDPSQVRPVNFEDFQSALTRVKSTVSPSDLHNYLAWDKQFGCSSV